MIFFHCCRRIYIDRYVSVCFKYSWIFKKATFEYLVYQTRILALFTLIQKTVTNSGLSFRKKHYLNLLHCSHGYSSMFAKAILSSFFSSLQYFEDGEEIEIFPEHLLKIDEHRNILSVFYANPWSFLSGIISVYKRDCDE